MAAQAKEPTSTAAWKAPWLGLFLILFAALGLYASIMLLQSELLALSDPDAHLACDVNPLVGCSSSLLTRQAHLLIIPNSALGLVAFGALAALGAVLLFKGSLPSVVWWGLMAGAVGGMAFVAYFVSVSVTQFKTLCPYCMLTWVAVLGFVPLAFGGAAASGSLGKGAQHAGKAILKYSWALALALYLVVVLVIVIGMPDKLQYLFH